MPRSGEGLPGQGDGGCVKRPRSRTYCATDGRWGPCAQLGLTQGSCSTRGTTRTTTRPGHREAEPCPGLVGRAAPPCVHTVLVPPGTVLCIQKGELGGWEQPSSGLVWGSGGSVGARRALWGAGLGWGAVKC